MNNVLSTFIKKSVIALLSLLWSKNRDKHRCLSLFSKINALHYFIVMFGGGERDRTDDPLLAKQVLSQLSYTPFFVGGSGWT